MSDTTITPDSHALRRAIEARILNPDTPAADLVPLSEALKNITHNEIVRASDVVLIDVAQSASVALKLWAEREQREMAYLEERRVMSRQEHEAFLKFRRDTRAAAKKVAKKRTAKAAKE